MERVQSKFRLVNSSGTRDAEVDPFGYFPTQGGRNFTKGNGLEDGVENLDFEAGMSSR